MLHYLHGKNTGLKHLFLSIPCSLCTGTPEWQNDVEMMLPHTLFEYPLAVQVPLNDLPSGEKRDMWLDIGPPKDKKEKNPLFGGIRVSPFFCL